MPAIDLVTANEFTFTPSAFIAAYIENNKEEFNTTETTTNGGKLKTLPGNDGVADTALINKILEANADTASAAKIAGMPGLPGSEPVTIGLLSGQGEAIFPDSGIVPSGLIRPAAVAAAGGAPPSSPAPGVSPGSTGPLVLNGAVIDLVGQTVEDTRTISKTVIKTYQLSVVLVLSYGTFKSPALDRAGALATVAAIYAQVQNYLNSL